VEPTVRIEQGAVAGTEHNGVFGFLGMPYAQPPVGDLRWRPPAPPTAWQGVRPARQFGPICPQAPGASFDMRVHEQNEDCLYVNVWTSTVGSEVRQPVMVWIHGGGFLAGAGSEDDCDGARLAARGVTVVTFNYRLGALGFAAHPRIPANLGVLDHVAALTWVARNIAAFGGDPDKVTIFGESAGAFAVRTLLSVGRALGLFHRAIMQSAGFEPAAATPPPTVERTATGTRELFDQLGGDDLAALRQVPASDIARLAQDLGVAPPPGQVHTPANLLWMPVPDGEVVARDGFPGWPDDVPIMLGCVENEARYFIKPTGTYNDAILSAMAKALAGPRAGEAVAVLDRSGLTAYEKLDKLFTTAIWHEPAFASLRRFRHLGRPVYYYHFARVCPGNRERNELAKHSCEIRYVFGNLEPAEDYDEIDARVSDTMQHAWSEFARTGTPSSPDGSLWPRYEDGAPRLTYLDETTQIRPFVTTELTNVIHTLRA